ncbi:Gfo/Idh/MocA family oxidoreductase [Ruania alkalisoli]|uniref:Gfo/Idh/MocA family oxidoreductase n=1 Tax=Ruania alkalisoli TaxID=2779775 RepID=A0A7M1SSM6_9MICO|nr:Gfo/Idh/MocA family oxidoreductase [Ruania alkalisoli]QOR70559.1 Gfo/Idh/MocA family oxidoreductase [Ruania alkalisoli]
MRAAVVGCGLIGGIYIDVLRRAGHAVVAVVDIDHDRAAAVAGASPIYADVEEMLSREVVDAVGISTPPESHERIVDRCVQRGIPMLCEKPLALTLPVAESMVARCRQGGVPLAIGFKMRFEALFRRVRDVIESGEIGALRYLHVAHYQQPRPEVWAGRVGVTSETLCHAIDLSRWLMRAEPIAVEGVLTQDRTTGTDEVGRIRLTFDDSHDALIAGGWMPDFPDVGGTRDNVLLAVGERGYALATRPGTLVIESASRRVEDLTTDYRQPFADQWRAFWAVLEGSASPDLAREADALAVQAIIDDLKATPNSH